MKMKRNRGLRSLYALVAMFLILCCWVQAVTWAEKLGEYVIKSALTYKFILLNHWPDTVFPDSDDRIHLCILGDPEGKQAFAKLDGTKVGNGFLALKFAGPDAFGSLEQCHVIFFGKDVKTATALRILAQVSGHPVLTIGEKEGFHAMGGVINFCTKNGKQFFSVSLKNMKQQQLQLGSRLLKYAVIKERQ